MINRTVPIRKLVDISNAGTKPTIFFDKDTSEWKYDNGFYNPLPIGGGGSVLPPPPANNSLVFTQIDSVAPQNLSYAIDSNYIYFKGFYQYTHPDFFNIFGGSLPNMIMNYTRTNNPISIDLESPKNVMFTSADPLIKNHLYFLDGVDMAAMFNPLNLDLESFFGNFNNLPKIHFNLQVTQPRQNRVNVVFYPINNSNTPYVSSYLIDMNSFRIPIFL